MKSIFSKADFKSGYVVELRNGEHRIVARAGGFTHILVNPQTQAWDYLSAWDDNLDKVRTQSTRPYRVFKGHDDGRDIVAVYGLVKGTDSYGEVFSPCVHQRELLWKRVQPKKMTMEELRAALGYEVEIVLAHQK